MISLLIGFALSAASLPELGELPPQKLARGQCALFLWDRASRKRFAMWPAGSALTLAEAGTTRSFGLVADSSTGNPAFGITPRARFEAGGETVSLELTLVAAPGAASATVQDGLLTRTLADGTALVLPVAGIVGCG
jgi:hypothetical protein